MPLAHLKVIGVMRGGDLYHARAEIALNIFVCNDRNFSADQRQNQRFPDQMAVSFIFGMHRHGGIAQQCFRASRCKLNIAAAVA